MTVSASECRGGAWTSVRTFRAACGFCKGDPVVSSTTARNGRVEGAGWVRVGAGGAGAGRRLGGGWARARGSGVAHGRGRIGGWAGARGSGAGEFCPFNAPGVQAALFVGELRDWCE